MGCSQPGSSVCLRGFPGKITGMGYHFLLQAIFLTEGSNSCLPYQQVDSLPLNHLESPPYEVYTRYKTQHLFVSLLAKRAPSGEEVVLVMVCYFQH